MDPEILCFLETTDSRGQGSYTVVRFYWNTRRVLRITVTRDAYCHQSGARAEVLTPALTWTRLVDDPPSRWYEQTSLYADKPTQVHQETGFARLAQIADGLYHDAVEILAHLPADDRALAP